MAATGSDPVGGPARIEALLVRVPPRHSRGSGSAGRRATGRAVPHALVRITDAGGTAGWGEAPGIDPDGWRALTESFAPALLRHAWRRPTEVPDAWADLAPCPAAAAALDAACWDLWSRRRGTPLAHALGGTRTALTAVARIARQTTPEALATEVNRQVGAGFRAVRLEIGPGWDVDPVRAVRERFPNLAVQLAGCGRYTESSEDLAALHALDDYRPLCLEQPFAAGELAAHARLSRSAATPVALDTSAASPEALDEAVRTEAGAALRVRVSAWGGPTPARRAADRAADAGWDAWFADEGETAVGRAARVALSSLSAASLPAEMPGAGVRPQRDALAPAVRVDDGVVPVPLTGPGLGHDVDEAALRAWAVDSAVLEAARPAAPKLR
ncbi:enolase C-terminal domain-like protein [Nocardiopsis coralliicola]